MTATPQIDAPWSPHKAPSHAVDHSQATTIIQAFLAGETTLKLATSDLDAMQIRGGFETNRYVGYDYANQKWLEVDAD